MHQFNLFTLNSFNLPFKTNEDCLYLNVFVPLGASATNLKAVMIFMHGGNFQWFGASSILFDGRFLANQGDVVVVTINYRLGIQNIN